MPRKSPKLSPKRKKKSQNDKPKKVLKKKPDKKSKKKSVASPPTTSHEIIDAALNMMKKYDDSNLTDAEKALRTARQKAIEAAARQRLPTMEETKDHGLPYEMKGLRVGMVEAAFGHIIRGNYGSKFEPKQVVVASKGVYTVESALGSHTYLVRENNGDKTAVMKTQTEHLPLAGPDLRREEFFFELALANTKLSNRTHFLPHIDNYIGNDQPSRTYAVFRTKYKFTLAEARETKLGGADFSPQTASRLCMQTLEAIHDVHQNSYIHRDIQPRNFAVGAHRNGVSIIYITGLDLAHDLESRDAQKGFPTALELAKIDCLNAAFQSRRYHTGSNVSIAVADLESWLYMCYDFFNAKALPWKQSTERLSERNYLNFKEAFFAGAFDDYFNSVKIPKLLHALRRKIALLRDDDPVDYPFFGFIIHEIAKNYNVDWTAPYEWQKGSSRSDSKSIDLTQNATQVTEDSGIPANKLQKKKLDATQADETVESNSTSSYEGSGKSNSKDLSAENSKKLPVKFFDELTEVTQSNDVLAKNQPTKKSKRGKKPQTPGKSFSIDAEFTCEKSVDADKPASPTKKNFSPALVQLPGKKNSGVQSTYAPVQAERNLKKSNDKYYF